MTPRMPRVDVTLASTATPILGREADLERLGQTLTSPGSFPVTITGSGGVGKTRLARELLSDPNAVFVDLTSVDRTEDLPGAVVNALGWQTPGEDAADVLARRLPQHDGLLLLDNYEHLLPHTDHVRDWLALAPNLKLVVTSRAPLGLDGERLVQLRPLALPEEDVNSPADLATSAAGSLFLRHARRVNPELALTPEDVRSVGQLLRLLDGLPLAIELVAARMDLFTPAAALHWLNEGRTLPSAPSPGLPQRQRSLRASVAWTVTRLPEELQLTLRRLAVFQGDFDVRAAAAVLDLPAPDTPRVLGILVRHSLLESRERQRYAMLETIRVAAHDLLREHGEAEDAHERHARAYAAILHDLRGAVELGEEHASETLAAELHQLRVAMRWLTGRAEPERAELAADLAINLLNFWRLTGRLHEGSRWTQRVLQTPAPVTSKRAYLRGCAGALALDLGRAEESVALLRRAVQEARASGDEPLVLPRLLTWVATPLLQVGRYEEAAEAMREALLLYDVTGPTAERAAVMGVLAQALAAQGELDEAIAVQFESIDRMQQVGANPLNVAAARMELASILKFVGRYEDARFNAQQASEVFHRHGFAQYETHARYYLAESQLLLGHHREAQRELHEALRLFREAMDTPQPSALAKFHVLLAVTHLLNGDDDQARDLARIALEAATGGGSDEHWEFEAALTLALLDERAGHSEQAARRALDLLRFTEEAHAGTWQRVDALAVIVRALLPRGQREAAARLLAAARAMLDGEVRQPEPWRAARWRSTLDGTARLPLDTDPRDRDAPASSVSFDEVLNAARAALAALSDRPAPSGRDRQLLRLLTRDFTNAQIAAELKLSPHTVRNRLARLYGQHGVQDRAALLEVAAARGWLAQPDADD